MKTNFNNGQSLFEVVVAVAISALIMVALVSLVSNSIQNASFSRNKGLAGTYAQEATEWLRGERDRDIASFSTNVLIPTWCLTGLSWTPSQAGDCDPDNDKIPNTPFIRQATFNITSVSNNGVLKDVIQADVVVSWQDSGGSHQVTSATNFADWRQR
ncbi:MAG TPA: hypothetical protein VFI61_01065 [Patescibacteria group bacterium]|nr:hypothetical protein [Patescibacteria group bacterium]